MKKICLFILFFGNLSAFSNDLVISGILRNEETKVLLKEFTITIRSDEKFYNKLQSDSAGKYATSLQLGHLYFITFSAKGFFKKHVEIDTRNIPLEEQEGGFAITMDASLVTFQRRLKAKIFKAPMAKCKYNSEFQTFLFDYEYTNARMKEIEEALSKTRKKSPSVQKD